MKVADSGSLSDKELNTALGLINDHQKQLIEAFDKVKNGEKIVTIKLK